MGKLTFLFNLERQNCQNLENDQKQCSDLKLEKLEQTDTDEHATIKEDYVVTDQVFEAFTSENDESQCQYECELDLDEKVFSRMIFFFINFL